MFQCGSNGSMFCAFWFINLLPQYGTCESCRCETLFILYLILIYVVRNTFAISFFYHLCFSLSLSLSLSLTHLVRITWRWSYLAGGGRGELPALPSQQEAVTRAREGIWLFCSIVSGFLCRCTRASTKKEHIHRVRYLRPFLSLTPDLVVKGCTWILISEKEHTVVQVKYIWLIHPPTLTHYFLLHRLWMKEGRKSQWFSSAALELRFSRTATAYFFSILSLCSYSSVLGPLLFTIYINCLGQNVPNAAFHFYADGSVIYCSASTLRKAFEYIQSAFGRVQAQLSQLKLVLYTASNILM